MMTNKPRFSITMEPELLNRVKDYQAKQHISTQSKAIQCLVVEGFFSLENEKKSSLPKETELDHQEKELIRIARELDPAQKRLLLRLVETAVQNLEKPQNQ